MVDTVTKADSSLTTFLSCALDSFKLDYVEALCMVTTEITSDSSFTTEATLAAFITFADSIDSMEEAAETIGTVGGQL